MTPEERRDTTEALYRQWHRMVYHNAYRLLHNAEDAQDVVQATFERVWRFLPDDVDGRIGGWVGRIGHNATVDALRRRSRRLAHVAPFWNDHATYDGDDGEPEGALAWANPERTADELVGIQDEARRLLATIRPSWVPSLRYLAWTGCSQTEAARAFDLPVQTLTTRLRLIRLRALAAERTAA